MDTHSFDVHSFVQELCGSNQTSQLLPTDITRISNEEFDIYIKRNQMLLMIDKRTQVRTVYTNLKTALHHLECRAVD
jgi:hypothetical protein